LVLDRSVESAVADRAPDPVVETVLQIARGGVRVAHAPAFEEHRAFVRLAVPVVVLEKQRPAALDDNEAAIDKNHPGGDRKLLGEDREFVGAPVPVGILANLDVVASLAGLLLF